jgi:DNA-binding NarL/FixJ family response regulator
VSEELGMPTRVMLVEDHADFRHVMTDLLVREPDLKIVVQAESLDGVRRSQRLPPILVRTSLEMVIRAGNAVRINHQN